MTDNDADAMMKPTLWTRLMNKLNFLPWRIKWLLSSKNCSCGEIRISKGTRTEINGVSHGETPCFECDIWGEPR